MEVWRLNDELKLNNVEYNISSDNLEMTIYGIFESKDSKIDIVLQYKIPFDKHIEALSYWNDLKGSSLKKILNLLCYKGFIEFGDGNFKAALKYFVEAQKLDPADEGIKRFITEIEYSIKNRGDSFC